MPFFIQAFRPVISLFSTSTSGSSRERVLALYRRAFKLARNWRASSGCLEDTTKEADYIRQEARKLFHQNASVTNPQAIEDYIKEAESRIELAEHYGTPYPRLYNLPPGTLAAHVPSSKHSTKGQKHEEVHDGGMHISRRTQRALRYSLPSYLKSYEEKAHGDDGG
ncbi:unnamed protein product [Calicophoron daubneyi]|uniref:Complex 1 LYR protein domain-containing protein n=1 Tax=Calicophoron daubneyi TaxID=300641 RepID=A0AAV2SZ52_CALDB